jgi:serine protease Do
MRECFPVVALLSFLSFPAVAADYAAYGKVAASVVRVVARIPNSSNTSFGSGVVLADGRVVTNCHVIRGAGKVVVMEGALGTEVERGLGDPVADLCVLHSVALTAPRAQTAAAHTLEVGDEVVAIGFGGGGGGRSISSGRVTALYPYRNGHVIQTTAAFRQGASGGGLFDRHGNLVGITTFYKRNGADSAFFAIPIEWIDGLTPTADVQPNPNPFWMRVQGDQPFFLQVAAYEADGKWTEMEAAARLWTREEPDQAQSWEALSRALMALGDMMEGGTAQLRARQASEFAGTSGR